MTGLLIGLLFDIFRILRKSFKTPDFITYIEDIIFWILSGLLLLYSIFKFNNGELRLFILIGIVAGISIYILIFSKIFVNTSVFIINLLKKTFNILIIVPIKFISKLIYKILIKPLVFISRKIKKIIKKILSNIGINSKKLSFIKKISKNKKDFA